MPDILQLDTLTDNFGDDAETFVQILNIFLEEVPLDYVLLKKQVAEEDYQQAGETAHKVKSSYRLLDMAMETMLLQEIENRAKAAKDTHEIPALFEQFDVNYESGIHQVTATRDHYKS